LYSSVRIVSVFCADVGFAAFGDFVAIGFRLGKTDDEMEGLEKTRVGVGIRVCVYVFFAIEK
jgi:hypothetical protein